MKIDLTQKAWWSFIETDLKELLNEALLLYDSVSGWQEKFHDYSFVVFPAAKAYEGYLKKLFLERGFITDADYYSNKFRIGRALNPNYNATNSSENIYTRIVETCDKGGELSEKLWITWKEARNLIFHWFPDEKKSISLEEAKEKIYQIIDTMDVSYNLCVIK